MIIKSLARVASVEWHTLYPWPLGKDSVVLDLGANCGRFAEQMTSQFGCWCHAIEASPEMYQHLKPTERISIYHYAIAPCEGTLTFNLASKSDASSILQLPEDLQHESVEVQGITLEGFVSRYGIGTVDLIKMDIEGAEISVFDSVSDEFLSQVGQLTVEFHDFCKLTPDADVRRIVNRLKKLGFFYVRMSGYGNQDALLINQRLHKLSLLERLYIKWVVRNVVGLMRVLRRKLGKMQ